jgi:hypothetical protein
MLKSIFLFVFLAIGLGAYAQPDATVTTGKPYPYLGASGSYFKKNNMIVAVKWFDKSIVLQRLNASTLTQEGALQYNDFPKDHEIERIVKIGEEVYVLYSVVRKPLTSLFVRKIDIARGEFVDAGQKIAEISDEVADDICASDTWEFSEHGRFRFYFSSDSAKFAICYRIKSKSLNSADSYEQNGVWVYDNTLTEKWHGNIMMPYSERKIDIQKRTIDSKANFHFLITKFNDDSTLKKKDGMPNYSLEVISYASPGEPIITSLDLKDKFIQNAVFNKYDGKVMCSGYYNNGKNPGGSKIAMFGSKIGEESVAGIFTVTLNGDGTHLPVVMHNIPLEVINEGESKSTQEKNIKKNEKEAIEFPMLSLLRTIVTTDGSLIIIGEKQYYITSQQGPQSFNYDDGLIAKILPNGQLAWIKKLRKEQTGRSSYRGKSYMYLGSSGDNYNFLFVDSKDNINAGPDESLKSYNDAHSGNGVLVLWQLNYKTGDITKKALVAMKNANGLHLYEFGLYRVIRLDERSFIFEAELRTVDRSVSSTGQEIKQEVLVKVEMEN